jgi:hypothetical protein
MSLFGRPGFLDACYIFGKLVELQFSLQTSASNGILIVES